MYWRMKSLQRFLLIKKLSASIEKDSADKIEGCPSLLFISVISTTTKNTLREEKVYLAYRLQTIIRESQRRKSSSNLEAGTEAEAVGGGCLLACSLWLN